MTVLYFLVPFLLLGIIVVFIAFSGGPGAARATYLSRGRRGFTIAIVLLYLAAGIAVPAAVIAGRDESEGGVGPLEQTELTSQEQEGKELFKHTCASCHNLDAVNAHGVTGPDLDEIGEVSRQRVLNAIKNGGTGQKRMPAGLLQDEDAQHVADYVSKVAGR